jgi:hypothetical protein
VLSEPIANPHARRHDGFYLRLGSGIGYGRAATKGSVEGFDIEATYRGAGPVYELLIGGTPARGFVVGGGFVGQDISSPSVKVKVNADVFATGEFTDSGALGVGALGPFIDWFPDDHGGFHVGALAGIGIIGLQGDRSFGGSLWTGYDFWIANQWSLGLEGRAVFATGSRTLDSVKMDDTAASYELLFTALYH